VRDDFFRAHAYPRPNYRKPGQSSPLKIFAFLLILQVMVDQLTIINLSPCERSKWAKRTCVASKEV
jgi:hypothetical protein